MDFRAELNLPSVIIDVPELQQLLAKKKLVQMALAGISGVVFLVLAGLIYIELTAKPKEVVSVSAVEAEEEENSSITLTVKLFPQNMTGAVVEVDGEVISGNPPYVYLTPSEDYHSLKVTAPGYETVSKDVQLTETEVMTFALVQSEAPSMAANNGLDDFDTDSLDSFGQNSDDLIEEIDDSQLVAAVSNGRRNPNLRGGGAARVQRAGTNQSGRQRLAVSKPAKEEEKAVAAATAGSEGNQASPVAPAAAAPTAVRPSAAGNGEDDNGSGGQYGLGDPAAPPSERASKASLIINAPMGMASRVSVSVDGQMRGYLPVLLKVDPGLHELTFVYEGHRSFQMVKLSSGQIVRIIPSL